MRALRENWIFFISPPEEVNVWFDNVCSTAIEWHEKMEISTHRCTFFPLCTFFAILIRKLVLHNVQFPGHMKNALFPESLNFRQKCFIN